MVFTYFSVPIDTGGSLTEAEKMLLLMCQSQSFPTKDETDMSSKVAIEINTTSSSQNNDTIQEEGNTTKNCLHCSKATKYYNYKPLFHSSNINFK